MSRRVLFPAVVAALLLAPAPALAGNGVTAVSPKAGDTVPLRSRPAFKVNVTGSHHGVFVNVCASKRKDGDGVICGDATTGKAKHKRGSRYEYKAKFFDFPEFWLNTPGTYYWQAYRTACVKTISDCKAEGPVVKFKVG